MKRQIRRTAAASEHMHKPSKTSNTCGTWGKPGNANCAPLGYYAASSGNSLTAFRDNISVPFSEVKILAAEAWYHEQDRQRTNNVNGARSHNHCCSEK